MIQYIDTHCHLDGEEFAEDREQVVARAKEAGVSAIFLPAIDVKSCQTVLDTCAQYPGYCYPMLGLHPEEVRADWREALSIIKDIINIKHQTSNIKPPIRIGRNTCRGLRSPPSGTQATR